MLGKLLFVNYVFFKKKKLNSKPSDPNLHIPSSLQDFLVFCPH